jgi:hypothetical protein
MADVNYDEVARILKADFETGKLYWLPRTPDMFTDGKYPAGEVEMGIQENRKVHFMRLNRFDMIKPTPYKLKKEPKRHKWLANICWKLLHRLGALEMYSETVTTWTYTPEAKKALTDLVWSIREELEMYFEEPERYVVVCGAYDFQEAVHSPTFRDSMIFSVGPFGTDRPYRRMFNIDVHVVPWLQGVAVLPRAVIEREVPNSRAA